MTNQEGTILTKKQLWMNQAPSFNFELDEAQILEKSLKAGFVTKVEGADDSYKVNENYGN